ncbi:MAG TPA: hypothetical protein VFS00_14335 [Polyangiaceae bacterium]|nr:hypothetical protein [Polyangiaceae bacterium]
MHFVHVRPLLRLLASGLSCLALAGGAGACGDDDDQPGAPGGAAGAAGGAGAGGASGTSGAGGASATAEELFAPGPLAVGYRQIEVRYQPAGGGAERVLPVHVWYPAQVGGEGLATYSVGGIVSLPSTRALAAPAPAAGGPFPLALYSHGSGGDGLLAYPYAERFAARDWVVAAPNHVGNTALDEAAGQGAPIAQIALDRPRDVSAVLDAFAGGLAGDPLAGAGRTDRVFLFGHSFGGYTALTGAGIDVDVEKLRAGCAVLGECPVLEEPGVTEGFAAGFGDARVAVAAAQAPAFVGLYADGGLGALGVPVLLMSGRLDKTTPEAENAAPAWAGLDGPGDLRVELPLGAHFSFVTICDDLEPAVLEAVRPGTADDGCGPAFTPVAEAVPALAAYLLGFARWHLLGEDEWAPLLRGEPLHPSLVVSTH